MFHINSSNGLDLSWFVLFFEAVLILSILNLLIFCWWIIVNEHRQTPCHMQSKDVQWRLQPFDGLLPRHTSLGYRGWNAPTSLTYVLELSNHSKIYGYQFYNNVWVYKANKNSDFRLSQGLAKGQSSLATVGWNHHPADCQAASTYHWTLWHPSVTTSQYQPHHVQDFWHVETVQTSQALGMICALSFKNMLSK